jgi:hypothetical protein
MEKNNESVDDDDNNESIDDDDDDDDDDCDFDVCDFEEMQLGVLRLDSFSGDLFSELNESISMSCPTDESLYIDEEEISNQINIPLVSRCFFLFKLGCVFF